MSEEIKKEQNEGKIDQAIKEVLNGEDVLKALSSDIQIKRFILNAFCEMLSQMQELRGSVDQLVNTINMVSQDKLTAFFKELSDNVKAEESKVKTLNKVKKSHQKAKN